MSTEDSRTAEGMRRDIVRHGAATWAVAMARPLADPPTEADKRGRLDVVVYAYGLERALAELHDVDPQLADRLAADLAADWEDGAAVGEWLWEHGVEIGVVVEGGVVGRDGVVRDSDRLCAEDAER